MGRLEIAAFEVQPREFRQHGRFAVLIMYLAADLQGFVQASQTFVVLSGAPVERPETAQRTDKFRPILSDPENRQRTFEMITSFFRLAELRIGVTETSQ